MSPKGPWSAERVAEYLRETRVPVRFACNGSSGHPVMASLWFVLIGNQLWCATQESSQIVALIREDPRCAFEVAEERPPYCGVRGRGIATLHPDRGESVLGILIERYLDEPRGAFARWLLGRSKYETAISIEPRTLLSWDFERRMRDAG